MSQLYKAPIDLLYSFVYGEWEGLKTIICLGDIEDYRYFHVDEGVPLPVSEEAEFEEVEMTRELAEQLRGQNIHADYLLPAKVPATVFRRQARLALNAAGLLDQVDAIMANPATPRSIKIDYQDAITFERNSATVEALAELLALAPVDVDNLFIAADQF